MSFMRSIIVALSRTPPLPTATSTSSLDLIKQSGKPALLLLNKTDKLADKSELLPLMQWYSGEHEWSAIVPISALKGDQIEQLLAQVVAHLPEREPLFAADELTDQSVRALAAEIVREKILETTGKRFLCDRVV